jgi:hypothetical protein
MNKSVHLFVIASIILAQLAVLPALSTVDAHGSSQAHSKAVESHENTPATHKNGDQDEHKASKPNSKKDQDSEKKAVSDKSDDSDKSHKASSESKKEDNDHDCDADDKGIHKETHNNVNNSCPAKKEKSHSVETSQDKSEKDNGKSKNGDCNQPKIEKKPVVVTNNNTNNTTVVLASNPQPQEQVLGAGVTTLPDTGAPLIGYALFTLIPAGLKLRKYTAK